MTEKEAWVREMAHWDEALAAQPDILSLVLLMSVLTDSHKLSSHVHMHTVMYKHKHTDTHHSPRLSGFSSGIR